MAFMQQLYSSTRCADVRMGGCDLATESLLQNLQFKAQQTCFETEFPNADLALILERDRPIGRLYVDYGPAEIRILDVCLLPEYRNRGIGLGLLRSLQAHGERMRLPLRINILLGSPAQRLLLRCGFDILAIDGIYNVMEWLPPAGI